MSTAILPYLFLVPSIYSTLLDCFHLVRFPADPLALMLDLSIFPFPVFCANTGPPTSLDQRRLTRSRSGCLVGLGGGDRGDWALQSSEGRRRVSSEGLDSDEVGEEVGPGPSEVWPRSQAENVKRETDR